MIVQRFSYDKELQWWYSQDGDAIPKEPLVLAKEYDRLLTALQQITETITGNTWDLVKIARKALL